jgi:hypothetical protein
LGSNVLFSTCSETPLSSFRVSTEISISGIPGVGNSLNLVLEFKSLQCI